jgi:hypothetical protein
MAYVFIDAGFLGLQFTFFLSIFRFTLVRCLNIRFEGFSIVFNSSNMILVAS